MVFIVFCLQEAGPEHRAKVALKTKSYLAKDDARRRHVRKMHKKTFFGVFWLTKGPILKRKNISFDHAFDINHVGSYNSSDLPSFGQFCPRNQRK